MTVKKQINSFCKLYSIYEEVPWSFSDKTEVDSLFILMIVTFLNLITRQLESAEVPT